MRGQEGICLNQPRAGEGQSRRILEVKEMARAMERPLCNTMRSSADLAGPAQSAPGAAQHWPWVMLGGNRLVSVAPPSLFHYSQEL